MNNTAVISIIVPVYNNEKYISKCLNSLINQTYKNIEIVCINDCSTDNSLDVLNEYAKRDSRIKVLNNEQNKGCSESRNFGLENCSGEYIIFVDGDDYIEITACEKFINKAKETGADLVVCTMHKAFSDNSNYKIFRPKKNVPDDKAFYFSKCPDSFYYIFTGVYDKLFKKESLKFYNTLRRSGDTVYFWEYCITYNPVISIINEPLYYYFQNPKSIVHSKNNIKDTRLFTAIKTLITNRAYLGADKKVQVKILDRFAKSIISEIRAFKLKRMPLNYYKKCKNFLNLMTKYPVGLYGQCIYIPELEKTIEKLPAERLLTILKKLYSVTSTRNKRIIKILGIKFTLKLIEKQSKKEKFYIKQYKKNRLKFPKDTYILLDCTTDSTVECIDAYSLFLYMKNKGMKVVYITMKSSDLYKKLQSENQTDGIISIDNSTQTHPGDFLEAIYEVLLQSKAILSSYAPFCRSTEKFLANEKQIEYILIQHGQIYIPERTLENKYLFPNRFNKILVSSQNEADLLTEHGWNKNSLLKAGLPRWDLLEEFPQKNEEKSILIMFTWRRLEPDKFYCSLYRQGILDLINDEEFTGYLKQKNIKTYFAYHHSLLTVQGLDFTITNDDIKVIDTQNISEYIKRCSCLITDFSSVSFDFMYQNKPVIYYLVDAGDNALNKLERKAVDNFNKNKDLPNVYYNKHDVVQRLKDYIETDFELEDDVRKMNDKFFFTKSDIREQFVKKLEQICE